ncbi:hypothetical protein ACT7DH_14600 [Bacillus pacificus]
MIIILISRKETLLSSVALISVVVLLDLNVGILESLVIAFYLCRWAGDEEVSMNICSIVCFWCE